MKIEFWCRQIFENLIFHKPSLWSHDVPQKIWAPSVQPFSTFIGYKQTDRQAKFIYRLKGVLMFPIGDLSDIISPIRNWMILKLFYWQKFIFEFSDSRCCHLQFFGIKNLKIHLRKFHNQSRHECFYETCHLGPFRNFLSLTSHINKVHGIDSYVNLKDGYRIHSETYPSEIDSGEIVKKETSKK